MGRRRNGNEEKYGAKYNESGKSNDSDVESATQAERKNNSEEGKQQSEDSKRGADEDEASTSDNAPPFCSVCEHAHAKTSICPVCGHSAIRVEFTEEETILHTAVGTMYNAVLVEFDEFFNKHCNNFRLDTEENALEYMDMFREYEGLVESIMEAHCKKQGFNDAHDFVEELQRGATKGSKIAGKALQKLIAVTEYPMFLKLMKRQTAKRQERGYRMYA